MKNILYIIAIVFSFSANAQTIVPLEEMLKPEHPTNNVYYKDVNGLLNKFLGTWVYSDSQHYLKIVVSKVTNQSLGVKLGPMFIGNISEDFIEVRYQYKVNGIEKYNTILATEDWITNGNLFADSSFNTVKVNHIEPSLTSSPRGKDAKLELKFIAPQTMTLGSQPQLNWKWKYVPSGKNFTTYPNGDTYDQSDYIIPQDLTLTKQ